MRRVTVLGLCVCVSVCYHVFCHCAQQCAQQDIPAASAGHEQSLKNGVFLVQKLWRHFLTAAASGAVAATLSFFFRRQRLLKLLKRLTVGLELYTWNTIQCKAASYFLSQLLSLHSKFPYRVKRVFSDTCSRTCTCNVGHQVCERRPTRPGVLYSS